MKLCIPVTADEGLASPVSRHFGSAPAFLFVDTETRACRFKANDNQHHAHGMCTPLAALQGEPVDALVVGGIGRGALAKLQQASIQIYLSEHATVAEVVEALEAGRLRTLRDDQACAGHSHA